MPVKIARVSSGLAETLYPTYGDEIEVNLGSLVAPDQLTATYELSTLRRESWLPAFPLARR